jgi:uncharacterized protein (TIGR02588 family)
VSDEARSDEQGRSPVEWVTFAVAVVIIGIVIALVAVEIPKSRTPPAPIAEPGVVELRGDRYVVPVVVENRGERTAAEVQVSATLTIDGARRRSSSSCSRTTRPTATSRCG